MSSMIISNSRLSSWAWVISIVSSQMYRNQLICLSFFDRSATLAIAAFQISNAFWDEKTSEIPVKTSHATSHLAFKTRGSTRKTTSVCFSVQLLSYCGEKCGHKTLPSTSSRRCPGWLESPRGISHVRNDIQEACPLPKHACSNYKKCTCVRLDVVGT